ncbi:MAG: hypothetical protein JWL62_2696 [Hyphomicrobiales bacterium]|nr:hypothetical protein [Hyphomicrobiales bacterium]
MAALVPAPTSVSDHEPPMPSMVAQDQPGLADSSDDEPTYEMCVIAAERAKALAVTLPHDDISRYFAERNLQQAMTEAGNGEFDDCLGWAQQAALEVVEHRHQLQPGEKLDILGPDQ